ncbi:MAG: M48 family metallopeptidase [Pseudomonadota bacterium]
MRQWIRQRAQMLFPGIISDLSSRTGLEFRRLSIRSQKTRWGSCSSSGNISLNDQLLFMPPDCVEYLIIHELCHTRHMNHGNAFWRLVEAHCPQYRQHERNLAQSKNWIPDWYLLDLYR